MNISVSNYSWLYCENNGLEIVEKYIDNGYSGTTFDRPGFQNLLRDIECGLINTVIVKDLSRLGRNYIQVGYYLHYYFPDKNVRFISINDGKKKTVEASEFLKEKVYFNGIFIENDKISKKYGEDVQIKQDGYFYYFKTKEILSIESR